MLNTLAIIGAGLVVLVAALLVYATTRPDKFRVERTAGIKAPPDKIFALINDFQRWSAWSPYEKLDPAMRRTHSGTSSGRGAVYEWSGNGKAGAGRMEIVETSPPSRIIIMLDFIKPFEAHNTAEFTLVPNGDATDVTWAIYGPSHFMTKVMGLFLNMDRLIGKDFEAGLANLKAVAEA